VAKIVTEVTPPNEHDNRSNIRLISHAFATNTIALLDPSPASAIMLMPSIRHHAVGATPESSRQQ
jgi:hypothetical protein